MEETNKIETNYSEDLLEQKRILLEQKRILLEQKDALLTQWSDLMELKQEFFTKLSNSQDHVNSNLLSA